MTRNRIIIFSLLIIVLVITGFIIIRSSDTVQGTVTAAPDEYSISDDGQWKFEIDGIKIEVGGGWVAVPDTYDSLIRVGDKVEAKIKTKDNGDLTIIDCSNCYVKKLE